MKKEKKQDRKAEANIKDEAKKTKETSTKKGKDEANKEKKEDNTETANSEKETEDKGISKEEKKELSPEEKYNKLNDRYLRLLAEYDNYRKRTLKEKMEMVKGAGTEILLNFLPVADNMERAKKSIDESQDVESLKEGINLIFKNLSDFLKARGVKEIDAVGKDFDTDLHEAITKIPAPEKKLKGKIVDIIEKGYMLNDKVLRFAKVVIGE